MWNFCQGRALNQLFSLLREFTLSWCVYIKSSPQSPENVLGCSCCPLQWSCPGISCSHWAPEVLCPLLFLFYLCVCISWDVSCDGNGKPEWNVGAVAPIVCIYIIYRTGCILFVAQCFSAQGGFSPAGSMGDFLSSRGDEWLVELNFVPALPSFMKHLMMTELAIKSRWFQSLEWNFLQWLYLGCFQPRS